MDSNQTLRKRRLGRTDIEVTSIGLGVMQFGGSRSFTRWMFPDIPQDQKNAIVRTALDGGINWFDTAEIYGFGHSESGLANALKAAGKRDDEVVVATKWFPIFRTARNIPRSINKRISNLDGYCIDLYMVHQTWGFSPTEDEMDAMADLVEAGKIHSIGVSNFNAERMRRAHAALEKRGLPLAANQVQYNLLDRKIESNGVLEVAKELGITIIAYSPLASGLLTGKFHKSRELLRQTPFGRRMILQRGIERSRSLIQSLDEIAAKHDATPAQVALNWIVNFHGDTIVAIPGASKEAHAEQSAGAMRLTLSDNEMDRLDILSRSFR